MHGKLGIAAKSIRLPDLKILLSPTANKQLSNLEDVIRQRIEKRLQDLAHNPFDHRISQQLIGCGGVRKSRVGTYRMLFEVKKAEHGDTLFVIAIEHRKDVYRRL